MVLYVFAVLCLSLNSRVEFLLLVLTHYDIAVAADVYFLCRYPDQIWLYAHVFSMFMIGFCHNG